MFWTARVSTTCTNLITVGGQDAADYFDTGDAYNMRRLKPPMIVTLRLVRICRGHIRSVGIVTRETSMQKLTTSKATQISTCQGYQ